MTDETKPPVDEQQVAEVEAEPVLVEDSEMSLEDKAGLQCMTDADKLVFALIDRLVLESELDLQMVTVIVLNACIKHYSVNDGTLRVGMTMLFDAFEME